MPFFKRVHITKDQQIENKDIINDVKNSLIEEALAAGHTFEGFTFAGTCDGWWATAEGFRGRKGFKNVAGAKASHTRFVKAENDRKPDALFISLTWEDVKESGRCRELWTQLNTA